MWTLDGRFVFGIVEVTNKCPEEGACLWNDLLF